LNAWKNITGVGGAAHEPDLYSNVAQQMRNVERAVANHLRMENKIHDEVLRKLERELDLVDAHFTREEG